MLSQEAELALGRLAEGAIMNPIHTTARELIDAGLAMNDWGRLALTEAGRRETRRTRASFHRMVIHDPHIHEMSGYQNPMGLGPEIPVTPSSADFVVAHEMVAEATISSPTIVRPESYYDRAVQAAGIASGKTGEWPTSEWVHAFMDAFDSVSEFTNDK